MDSRPTWDEWGLALAATVATRADCTRRQVGAVLMTPDHSIVATGYNGAPAGEKGCLTAAACPRGRSDVPGYDDPSVRAGEAEGSSYDIGPGACIAIHAEQNALLRATWDEMFGATLYVTDEPCPGCWRMIRATPIHMVVYPTGTRRNR
jgi:dCMP deaminase